MKNEQARLKRQQQEEVTTAIAVVNLDEGIWEEGKRIYYSSELMSIEEEIFVAENLETARQGIFNGTYAAYILIPSDFSERAVSINTIPEKAVLEFAINPNLREDISRLTMLNVKNFEISLNTNMSYMYVQGLLKEFHAVQDSSGQLLSNDAAELQRILAMDADELIVEPEYTKIEAAKLTIEPLDFEESFLKNEEIVKGLNEHVEELLKKTEEAVKTIEEINTAVGEGMKVFYTTIGSLDITRDEEGNLVYGAGVDAMNAWLSDYPTVFEEQKKKTLGLLIAYDTAVEESLIAMEEKIDELEASLSGGSGTGADAGTVLQELRERMEALKEIPQLPEEEALSEALQQLDQLKLTPLRQLAMEIDAIPRIDSADGITIMQEQLLTPVEEKITAENSQMQEAGAALTTLQEEYLKKISEIDWYSFYDIEEAGKLLTAFGENVYDLEEKILKNQMAYEDFVYETIDTTNAAMETHRENLDAAYEGTVERFSREVELAKEQRSQMNEINKDILGSFQEKLPYTRIGQLEYVQAYDFMAKPIKMTDTSVEKKQGVLWQDYTFLQQLLAALVILYGLIRLGTTLKAVKDEASLEEDMS